MRLLLVPACAALLCFLFGSSIAQPSLSLGSCPPAQWATSVKEVSYENADAAQFGRQKALGPPDATQPAQNGYAWAASPGAAGQYITLCYDKPQQLGLLEIYENYGIGRITTIKVANVDLTATWNPKWVTVYNMGRDVCTPTNWRVWRAALDLSRVNFKTNCVRLEIDGAHFANQYVRIDAVGMIGDLPNGTLCDMSQTGIMPMCDGTMATVGDGLVNGLQWASSVKEASYDYPDPYNWGRDRILGPPDAPTGRSRSWIGQANTAGQYVTVCYDTPMWLQLLEVRENWIPCRINKISVTLVNLTSATWSPQWTVVYDKPIEGCQYDTRRTWRPVLDLTNVKTKINCVRLDANPAGIGDHWMIDAVGIRGGVGATTGDWVSTGDTWLPQYPTIVPVVSGSQLGTQIRGSGQVGSEQLLGPPTKYPQWGISDGVWEPGNQKSEWAVVCFERRMRMKFATLYETLSPGMVHTVSGANLANVTAATANDTSIWTPLYRGQSQFVPGTPGSQATNYQLDKNTTFTGNCLRLELDGSSPWQYALDAVLLLGITV